MSHPARDLMSHPARDLMSHPARDGRHVHIFFY